MKIWKVFFPFFAFLQFFGFASAATQEVELMTGRSMTWSTAVFEPGDTVTELSDGDTQRFIFSHASDDPRQVVWVTLDQTYDIVRHYFVGSNASGYSIQYYDEDGNLIRSFGCMCNNSSVFVPDVKTIAFVNSSGWIMYAYDVKVWGVVVPVPEEVQLTVSDVSYDRLTLNFSAKSGTYTSFDIYQGEQFLKSFTSSGSYEVLNLSPDTSYTFRLDVWNEGKKATQYLTVRTPKAPIPMQQPVIEVVEVGSDRVNLRITAVGADEIDLFRDGVLLRSFSPGVSGVASYLDLGLSSETEYVYRVVARNDYEEKSSETNVKTLAKPPPPVFPPLPVPDVGSTPMPPVDTGNEDFDRIVEDVTDAGQSLKIGGMTIIFWAILIGVIIFGAFWLWLLWRSWMGRAFGTGAGSSGGSGTGSGSRAYRYVKQVKLGGKGRSSVVGTGSVRLGGRASRVSRVSRSKTSRSSGVEVFEHQGKVYEVNMVHWDPAKVKKPAASYLNKFQ